MNHSDPIADLLTRVRNASEAKRRFVDVQWSKIKENISKILQEEGYIEKYLVRKEDGKVVMRLVLKYSEGRNAVINGLRRISSPGCRKYVTSENLPLVLSGLGISILTTSQGLMTARNARQKGVGGEVLCHVW